MSDGYPLYLIFPFGIKYSTLINLSNWHIKQFISFPAIPISTNVIFITMSIYLASQYHV